MASGQKQLTDKWIENLDRECDLGVVTTSNVIAYQDLLERDVVPVLKPSTLWPNSGVRISNGLGLIG